MQSPPKPEPGADERPIEVQQIKAVAANPYRFTTSAERIFTRIMLPFESFIKNQTTSSLLLLLCAVTALVLENSSWRNEFNALFEYHFSFSVAGWGMDKPLGYWVNDGLMALFFFILGLEIKRELLVGEFREIRRAALLIVTAAGGMIVPALIFRGINPGWPEAGGWGIPMATDTAFAIGALVLLGRRVPRSMITFLAGLAIVDDIGGILVIALFYTKTIDMFYLAVAATALVVLALANWLGVRRPLPYVVLGVITWLAVLESGLHATLAGVLVAFTVPARPRYGQHHFAQQMRELMQRFSPSSGSDNILAEEAQFKFVRTLEETARQATTPLQRWQSAWEWPVALMVLPLFALDNAGIPWHLDTLAQTLLHPVTLGIALGLVLGKSIGITAACWIGVKSGLGELPGGIGLKHVIGLSLFAGVGFTMSLYIAGLAYNDNMELLLLAKHGILLGSFIAGMAGLAWLLLTTRPCRAGRKR